MTDGLDGHTLLHVGDVVGAGGQGGHTGTGEADLGGGGELDDEVLVAVLHQFGIDVQQHVALFLQMVQTVGVIPHDAEVGGGRLHSRQTTDGIVGIGDAVGVGVHRHAPHTLDSGVGDELLDGVHVRAVGAYGSIL